MTFDDLVNFALLGTGRSALTIAADDDAVAAAFADTGGGSAEDRLLSAAAVLCAYELCGIAPAASTSVSADVAAADERPACSRRAADLLAHLLALPKTPTRQHLMEQWLQAAARATRRAPHALLPALLDYGADNCAAREAVAAVIGQRGLWLRSLNERWQLAVGDEEDLAPLWTTGNREQRASALRRLRGRDPAAARELVRSTWKEDGADERAVFVEALLPGLDPEDEPFLEAALDDRSKQVRTAAADLLSRLPGSALVRRMIARVDPLLTFRPASAAGLLRRAHPASVEVALPPPAFDPAWARDGVTEKPPQRMGQRQWWLQQLLAAVPPSHWATKWQLAPTECIAAVTGEFAELLCDGWADAAERHRDPQWLLAMFRASLHGRSGGPRFELVARLPADLRRVALLELLSLPDINPVALGPIFNTLPEFDESLASLAIAHVERQVAKGAANYNHHVGGLLAALALRVPAQWHDRLLVRWVGPAWEANASALGQFFHTLQLRRDIQAEFTS